MWSLFAIHVLCSSIQLTEGGGPFREAPSTQEDNKYVKLTRVTMFCCSLYFFIFGQEYKRTENREQKEINKGSFLPSSLIDKRSMEEVGMLSE
jgi:hypothetical protein